MLHTVRRKETDGSVKKRKRGIDNESLLEELKYKGAVKGVCVFYFMQQSYCDVLCLKLSSEVILMFLQAPNSSLITFALC